MSAMQDHPLIEFLSDGQRLHLRHGPIDLVIGAEGSEQEVMTAYRQAVSGFGSVLPELADELELLRQPCTISASPASGAIARNMQRVTTPLARKHFLTPMIAVAGAVADHMLGILTRGRVLRSAYVNNGGDIAVYLSSSATFNIGICDDLGARALGASVRIGSDDGISGIATSGWKGRSFSLGIADAVTVLARDAATADTAATLIANHVDLPRSEKISRTAARDISPDSDLGGRLVTTSVDELSSEEVAEALEAGRRIAVEMIQAETIVAAFMSLQGERIVCGELSASTSRLEGAMDPRGKPSSANSAGI